MRFNIHKVSPSAPTVASQTTCLRDSRRNLDRLRFWSRGRDRPHTHTSVRVRVHTPAATTEKTKGLSLLWKRTVRPHEDNCRKYGRRTCVTRVICRVITGAGNSSSPSGAVRVCCLLRFRGIRGRMRSAAQCNCSWDQSVESCSCFTNLDPVTQVSISIISQGKQAS